MRKYFLVIFLLALNIYVFKAQDTAVNINEKGHGEQSVRDYVSFIKDNSDKFDILCGDGFILGNNDAEERIGAFWICYYSEEDDTKTAMEDNLLMIDYGAKKNDYRNLKTVLFKNGFICYYREDNFQFDNLPEIQESFLEIFFTDNQVLNFYFKGYPFTIDVDDYVKKIRQDVENEDFHDSVFDFYDLQKK